MPLLSRHIEGFAEQVLATFPAAVIQGARQVGKSTLATRLASGRDALGFTLDDPQTLAAAREDPIGFVDQHREGVLVIDEVQRHPELMLAVKASIDRDRRPGRFLLTGSSDLLRTRRVTDSLAGRAATVPLRPLSRGELGGRVDDFCARFRDDWPYREFQTSVTKADYVAMIAGGGFPEVQSLDGRMRNTWFDSYLDRIVRRDAQDLTRMTDPGRLMTLLRLLSANQAGELVKARVAQDAAIPPTTITAHLDTLETLFLVDLLPPWTPNLTSRETGKSKAVVADSGLAARLSRVAEAQLASPGGTHPLGGLVEGFVVGELLKQRTWSREEFELFHYRTRTGIEVDVVVEFSDGQVLGLEVKSGATFRPDHFSGLKSLRDRLGDRFVGGVVLNTGDRGYRFGDRLHGLPIAALWES
jgi:predicted AAA+ superfamily ATPase